MLELLIALSIGLVLLGAVTALYLGTQRTGAQTLALARMSEDATVALQYLAGHIRMAGASPIRLNAAAALSEGRAGASVLADRYFVGAGLRGCDHGFAGPRSDTVPFEDLQCAPARTRGRPQPAALVIRYEADDAVTLARTGAAVDCKGQAIPATSSSALGGGSSFKLLELRFTVKTDKRGVSQLGCAGNGRAAAAGSGPTIFKAEPLFERVEDMVVRYGLVAADGPRVAGFVSASAVDAAGGSVDARWRSVIGVDLCLLMHSDRSLAGNVDVSYVDCHGQSIADPGDGVLRQAFSMRVTLRNRAPLPLGGGS